jgi:prophage tail gpP-like protein
MATDDTLRLMVGDREHTGWKSITVSRSVELAASSFQVAMTPTADGATGNPMGVRAGQACEVWIGDDRVLTGWIDAVEAGDRADGYTLGIDGRSKTGDLVDCSAAPAQFRRQTLAQIAGALAVDYDVDVVDLVGLTTTYRRVRSRHGETVFAVLDRLARDAMVLLTDDEEGRLVITRVGTERGDDITAASPVVTERVRVDLSQRFSVYEVRGQTAGDDQNYAAAVAHGYGEILDEDDLDRVRRLELQAESGQGYKAACIARATNEAVTRAGRSVQMELQMGGWRMSDGRLWWTNRLHRVDRTLVGVAGDMVVSSVTFSVDNGGLRTQLLLVPPGMYEFIAPTKRPKRKKKITAPAEEWIKGRIEVPE